MRIKRKPKIMPRFGKQKADYTEDKVFAGKLYRIVLLALELSDMTDKEAKEFQNGFLD